jgi:pimeloyl-ACP methyl ester carboxylesterase
VATAGFFGSTASRIHWTIDAAAHDVAGLVDVLGLAKVVLAGHSMGSAIALSTAALLGGRVDHVVAIDGLHYLEIYPAQDETHVEARVSRFKPTFAHGIHASDGKYSSHTSPALMAEVDRQMLACDPRVAIPLLQDLYRWDLDEALVRADTAITVLASRQSLLPAAVARYAARIEFVPTDIGGHFFLLEDPEATAALIIAAGRMS